MERRVNSDLHLFLAAQSAPLAGACGEDTPSPRSGAASRIFSVYRVAVFLHLTGARLPGRSLAETGVQREEGAESESGLRKSADGKSDGLPLGGLAVRVLVPASEGRGGGVAARPAKVSPQKDQEKRAFSASSSVAALLDPDSGSPSGDSSGAVAAWDKSFVFQVSEPPSRKPSAGRSREPALRVTYPPPFNVVAALSRAEGAPASENAERSVWWPLAVLIRTFYDRDFARVVQEKQLLRSVDLSGMASGV
jgi:hypothetical protein